MAAGERLGPYYILEKIGTGGMGEVYRARDERLGREVAIKVSSERFNERFEREAKLIASLNHHNICSLFDVGANFLVMELIDGPTLAERIAEGPIPVEEALHIAAQVAEGLQAAHDSGIVHRDLKPGNIKIRPDGTVKVLDFGLAKNGVVDTSSAGQSDSPTMNVVATQAGIILGTAAYMSPEQARGKPVDKRADIWAFGAVLYEMLTCRPLFRGEDVSETLASVIMKEPDLDQVPPKVRQVLRRCLQKDPQRRLRDISGVALLLEKESASGAPVRQSSSRLWPALTALATILAAALGIGWYRSRPPEAPLKPLMRLNVELGSSVVFASSAISSANVVIAPDGLRLAYISQSRLFIQKLDQSNATELSDTNGAFGAFFSPDSKWLAFFAGGKLKKISVDGGPVLNIGDTVLGRGGSWGEDGYIIASLASTGILSRIPEGGGAPMPVTELAEGETTHRWPHIVPGGKAVVYTAHSGPTGFDSATIKLKSFADGKTKTLQQGGTAGRVVKTRQGHAFLLYVTRGALFAEPFDLDRLEVVGNAVPILEGIGSTPSGAVEMDISDEGTVVYRSTTGGLVTVQWMDSSGKMAPFIEKAGVYGRPALSPDGNRLALEVSTSGGSEIYVYEPRGDNMSKLTFGKGQSAGPIWSTDGSYIVYQDTGGLMWIRSNGGGPQPLLKGNGALMFPWSFSPDGKRLSYMESSETGYDLYTAVISGDADSGIHAGKPEPFLTTKADERAPAFSPDGKWMAYSSNENGTTEVYVRAFPDNGSKWQISNGGGNYPRWSRATQELIFENPDAHILAVSYTIKGNAFIAEKQRPWSPKPLVNLVGSVRNFDLAPDGKRIAALMPADKAEDPGVASHVNFVINFFDELERRVPLKK
jgi:serine/threonine-protein kinase